MPISKVPNTICVFDVYAIFERHFCSKWNEFQCHILNFDNISNSVKGFVRLEIVNQAFEECQNSYKQIWYLTVKSESIFEKYQFLPCCPGTKFFTFIEYHFISCKSEYQTKVLDSYFPYSWPSEGYFMLDITMILKSKWNLTIVWLCIISNQTCSYSSHDQLHRFYCLHSKYCWYHSEWN